MHPGVGGVLVRGEKGTAKSTAVRALAALLPAVGVVPGCRFGCDPADPDPACPDGPHPTRRTGCRAGLPPPEYRAARLVELPVGATEDRLVGSLDLERALAAGVRAYQPGLLAEAHRGVLYVDEVNLLHDHLVDLLLDAAAMGRAHVERDGVSVSHAARFLLVGTMNPEEGELRPQLLDRFGLAVEVRAARDVDTRVEVVRRRMAYEADPAGFAAAWADEEAETAGRIAAAQARLGSVVLPGGRAAPDRRGVRRVRRRRDAGRPGDRPGRAGPRGLARGGRGGRAGRAGGGPARAAAPAPPRPLRRARRRRVRPGRRPARRRPGPRSRSRRGWRRAAARRRRWR